MPRVKPGPFKWTVYYTWVPLWVGRGKDRHMDLDVYIGGWWALDAWADWEYRAVYDTKEEAEREAEEIIASDPEKWSGVVHVAPTLTFKGDEILVTKLKEEVARRDREADEWGKKHDAEAERLEASLRAQGWTITHKRKA